MLDTFHSRPGVSLRDHFARELVALRPELRARALRLTRNEALAEDLVQDAIERALKFRDQYTPGTNLKSWAQTIVFSLFVTGWRRRRREREAVKALAIDPCAWTSHDDVSLGAEMRDLSPKVRRALDELPRAFREVVLMVDVGDRSYRDAAVALGVPIGTVMSRLHRARRQLAASLAEPAERAATREARDDSPPLAA
ncbi:MAG: RNA polymerase sigma factor [Deltaproteobacteria bacterium]|nr:RNA polymerase sigma factor [Deltaproteobacteria bacterium]